MRTLLHVVFLFFSLLLVSVAYAAPTPPDDDVSMEVIAKAINDGDAATLANYLDATVDITVIDKEGSYDKSNATRVLKDFFAAQKPKSFTQMHSGTPKGKDAQYVIGTLQTATLSFRVYVYMKTQGDKTLIQEMRFEKA